MIDLTNKLSNYKLNQSNLIPKKQLPSSEVVPITQIWSAHKFYSKQTTRSQWNHLLNPKKQWLILALIMDLSLRNQDKKTKLKLLEWAHCFQSNHQKDLTSIRLQNCMGRSVIVWSKCLLMNLKITTKLISLLRKIPTWKLKLKELRKKKRCCNLNFEARRKN